MDCFYMSSKNLSKKPKKTWVFLVFWLTWSKSSSKKNKKKTLSFFSFFKVMTKKNQKNSRKTKKKQTWASDQTFSEKFWFFGFLVFSRFFGFWFSRGLASRGRRICEAVTSGPYLILVLQLCFSFFVAIYPKKHIPFGLWYPLFPYANAFPQNMSGNLF